MTQPLQQPLQQPLRLALIGLGAQGDEHLDASKLCQQTRIIAGVDASPEQRQRIAQKYADLNLQLFDSVEALKTAQQQGHLSLDGLILALPHHVYTHVWQDILSFGVPLLKEKPLGRDYEEAQRFVEQADAARCSLQMAIQRRHHPSYTFLRYYLQKNSIQVNEVHAHLHLGKGQQTPPDAVIIAPKDNPKWRDDRLKSGGGALLDAGYHLVDLIHFLIGPFEAVSATMWASNHVDDGRLNEDRSWLTGRSERCWIMVETWVQGLPDPHGSGFLKSEEVKLATSHGLICSNREGVWHDGALISPADRSWQQAMQNQLRQFADHIRHHRHKDESIWEQLPAMRLIEEAYRLSSRY